MGHRIGVIGASGALGTEVLELLSRASLAIDAIVPVGTERSLGVDIEFQGAVYAMETEPPSWRELDLALLCAPPAASSEAVRQCLRHQVPCIDVGGALAAQPELPLRVAAFGAEAGVHGAPLLVAPPPAALALALALRPLGEATGVRRVVATLLEGASRGGRDGIETLYKESVAVFNQEDLPEPDVFGRPVAFDCLPLVGEANEDGADAAEERLRDALGRLLDGPPRIALSAVQVPIFVGFGATLAVETERELAPAEASELLAKAPGLERWEAEPEAATPRAAAGGDAVLVAQVRRDPTVEHGLQLWLAADVLRVAAANAVRLAVSRLAVHH